LNIFGPHIYPMAKLLYATTKRALSIPISQQEMNELYLGEEFALSVSLFFTCLIIILIRKF
jgi:hypothetical protein